MSNTNSDFGSQRRYLSKEPTYQDATPMRTRAPQKRNPPLNHDEILLLLKFFSSNESVGFKSYCDTHAEYLGETCSDKRRAIQQLCKYWQTKGELPTKYKDPLKYPAELVRSVSFKLSLIGGAARADNKKRKREANSAKAVAANLQRKREAKNAKVDYSRTPERSNNPVTVTPGTNTGVANASSTRRNDGVNTTTTNSYLPSIDTILTPTRTPLERLSNNNRQTTTGKQQPLIKIPSRNTNNYAKQLYFALRDGVKGGFFFICGKTLTYVFLSLHVSKFIAFLLISF